MPDKKPNILVIWGDDIGISNLSCYSHGLMGYETPNIDRLAKEGMMFTDSYGEQSCTAGRSSFITGQSVYRTGLSKVGIPGAKAGLQAETVTIAELSLAKTAVARLSLTIANTSRQEPSRDTTETSYADAVRLQATQGPHGRPLRADT
jgi:Sulfatase